MATQLVTKRCDLGSLGVPGLASMFGGQTSWLARMFGLCQDDIILAEANILAYPKVCIISFKSCFGLKRPESAQAPGILGPDS